MSEDATQDETHDLKAAAARAALDHVEDGMRLGIGTGSTAERFIEALAERVEGGLRVTGVPTSERTARLCMDLGVPLASLDETPRLDLCVDGADEIGPNLVLVKGGGGALLREKIVAWAADRMVVIADESKVVDALGAFPLPVTVSAFGATPTRMAIETEASRLGLTGEVTLREGRDGPFRTDGGNCVLDASFGRIDDPEALAHALHRIPGVLEHGLFLDLATLALVAGPDGVRTLRKDGDTT